MESGGRINEGNWIAYLKSKDKLNSYTWIRNENSRNVEWTQFNTELIGQENYTHTTRDFYLIEIEEDKNLIMYLFAYLLNTYHIDFGTILQCSSQFMKS